ncbi:hypothetical protein ACFQ7B_25380 [Streptomyces erythrochromogenes]|uniref:hypothetical protein n=1 Tax=Streptomyces erythrochromogenes TaxID=285574 RepID=UPI0036790916
MTAAEDAAGPRDAEFLRLPGLRRHLAAIERDLGNGFTCLWLLPSPLVERVEADLYVDELCSTLNNVVEIPCAGTGDYSAPAPASSWQTSAGWYDDGPGDGLLDDYDDGLGDPPWLNGGYTPTVVPKPAHSQTRSTLEERLSKRLGVAGDPVEYLTAPESPGGAPIILIRAWQEEDDAGVARLLRRLTAAVKGSGLAPGRRPRLLVAARLHDLTVDAPESLDAAFGRVHWWWSVWGRLDTATVIADAVVGNPSAGGPGTPAKRILGALLAETVSEISGPDMWMALRLAAAWDGRLSSLRSTLSGLSSAGGRVVAQPTWSPVAGHAAAAYGSVPGQPLRSQWSAGLLDSWEGQLRPSVPLWIGSPSAQNQLDKLVWQSQNRVLLPLIDDARAEFTGRLPRFAAQGIKHLHHLYRDRYATVADLDSMELGDIWSGVNQGFIRMNGTQYNRLKVLRDARNELAHRRPLDDRSLDSTVRVLTQPADDQAGPPRRAEAL